MPAKRKQTNKTLKTAEKPKSTARARPARKEKPPPEERSFPVVGIGASAGGLKAFEEFFRALPPDSGMAFIVVAHLDPAHATILHQLLQKYTEMRVQLVKDGMVVQPNCIYVIPPNKSLAITQNALRLFPKEEAFGSKLPIDAFFRTLAADQGRGAIAVVLSGAGADGSMGIRAIKSEGGMVMVQDAKTAQYDGMPLSAQATGVADYVLPPEKMPEHLSAYANQNIYIGPEPVIPTDGELQAYRRIFLFLKNRTGHDFSQYKKNTIRRRILRRMGIYQIGDIASYAAYLDQNPQEIRLLFNELLIGVTNFFRDPEAFDALKENILPRLLAGKPEGGPIRIWVPGCSTGEEAYSLAILLQEVMGDMRRNFYVQVFATDIDNQAIEAARIGVYPLSIASDVGAQRLKALFTRLEKAYRIKKDIREMVVFAVQDVIKDPPFIRMDLISCRNLLIYLEPELQKKLIPIFHYGLNPEGVLFLGYSESVDGYTDLFSVLDKKYKIFRREGAPSTNHAIENLPALHGQPPREPALIEAGKKGGDAGQPPGVPFLIKKILMESHTPSCAVVDDGDDIVYIHGRTGKYLEPATGAASLNIVEMARPGLKGELSAALRLVRTQKRDMIVDNIEVKYDGGTQLVNLKLIPLENPKELEGMILVVFRDLPARKSGPVAGVRGAASKAFSQKIDSLEKELKLVKSDLESAIEELQSANEELQSSNEEMETSKEELQSLNEELVTVNNELQARIEELAQTNDDLKNFFDSAQTATIFLDNELRVKRFSPKATEMINLIGSDIGRPVGHLVSKLKGVDLVQISGEVLRTLAFREIEAEDSGGRHYLMRVMPYRTVSNVIDGVVVTFVDITERKQAEQAMQHALTLAENVIDTVHHPMVVLNSRLRVVSANRAFYEAFGITRAQVEKKGFFEIDCFGEMPPDIRATLEGMADSKAPIEKREIEVGDSRRGKRSYLLNARPVVQEPVEAFKILVAFEEPRNEY